MRGERNYLGELELLQFELLHDLIPDNICSCKKPASTTGLLICDRSGLELYLVVEDVGYCNGCWATGKSGLDVGMRKDCVCKLDLWVCRSSGLPGVNVRKQNGTIGCQGDL